MICIICKKELSQKDFDDEHVFPESIGGKFILKNSICKKCNHLLGSKVDSLLVDHFLIKFDRYLNKIPNKEGVVPNIFGLGTLKDDPAKKILWKFDKKGNPIGLHLYPDIQFRNSEDGLIELEIDADESYGEDFILKQVKKKLERLGKNVTEEELKKYLIPMEHDSYQPTINYSNKIHVLEYQKAILKIAYEMAYYWLGKSYLNDTIGERLRKLIYSAAYEELSASECFSKYKIRGKIDFLRNMPFLEFDNYKNHHIASIFRKDGGIYCYIRIFNLFVGFVCVSENSGLYNRFKYRSLVLDYRNRSCIESENIVF